VFCGGAKPANRHQSREHSLLGLAAANVLTIDPAGNDAIAAADPTTRCGNPPYDITATTPNTWDPPSRTGAHAAKCRRVIIFNPGVYLLPALPLNHLRQRRATVNCTSRMASPSSAPI